MKWGLVVIIVVSTTFGEVLQTLGMKRHGEILNFRPGALRKAGALVAKNPYILISLCLMAVSFFSFMALLSIADLSFAVPVTAASYVLETILAKYVLKERVCRKRWVGAVLVAGGVALLAL